MEVPRHAIIKAIEEYEGYDVLDAVHYSVAAVKERHDGGLLTKDQILEKYTHEVQCRISGWGNSQPEELRTIETSFERLCDPLGNLSQAKLERFFEDTLVAKVKPEAPGPAVAVTLCNLFNWHSAFPFPLVTGTHQDHSPVVDKAAFVRAVSLLTVQPPPPHPPSLGATASHGVSGGTSAKDPGLSVSFVTIRGKDAQDYRRRLFRSLAVPISTSALSHHHHHHHQSPPPTHWLAVPRMIVKPTPTPEQLDDLDFDLDAGTVCYVAQEDDRDTDRLDILAETPPADWHRPMRRPNRDAFAMVLPTLPRHELGLHEMCVPIDTLDALVGVLAPLRGGDSGGGGADDSNNKKNNNNNNGGEGALGSLVDRARTKAAARMAVEVGACLTWEEFDEVLRVEGCTASMVNGLDKIYSVLKHHVPESRVTA